MKESKGKFTLRDIPPDLHRKLKVLAASSGESMNNLILYAIRDYILRHEGKK